MFCPANSIIVIDSDSDPDATVLIPSLETNTSFRTKQPVVIDIDSDSNSSQLSSSPIDLIKLPSNTFFETTQSPPLFLPSEHTLSYSESPPSPVFSHLRTNSVTNRSEVGSTIKTVDVSQSRFSTEKGKNLTPNLDKVIVKERKKLMKTLDKEWKQRKKIQEKEKKQIEKEQQQEQKKKDAEEKKKLKSVNRNVSKEDSTKEMQLRISESLLNGELGNGLVSLLSTLECPFTRLQNGENESKEDYEYILFFRNITREFDSIKNMYLPLKSPKLMSEHRVLFYFTAEQFCNTVLGDIYSFNTSSDMFSQLVLRVNKFIHNLKSQWPQEKFMFILQGLEKYYRKKVIKEGKAFRERVQQLSQESTLDDITEDNENVNSQQSKTGPPKRRKKVDSGKKKQQLNTFSREILEQLFIYLELEHQCFLTTTQNSEETLSLIRGIIREISHLEFKKRYDDFHFCANMKVPTGEEPLDIMKKMLQQVSHVTESMSRAIADGFGNIHSLYQAWDKQGPRLLEAFEYQGPDGRLKRMNRPLAEKLYRLFHETDPHVIL